MLELLLLSLLFAANVEPAQSAAVGVAPSSISIPAPVEKRHNPHSALGVPYHSWILAPATVTIDPDGRVTDMTLRPISVVHLSSNLGTFQPVGETTLIPRDAERFENAARAALQEARFEKQDGGAPRRSFVNLAWKAYGGSMNVEAAESGGSLRHAPNVLARTFAKGTTFYVWGGVEVSVEAKPLETIDDDNRRLALGLPSPSFVEKLGPSCRVLESAPSGTVGKHLDNGLLPLEPLELEFPERKRRDRDGGIVILVAQVASDGSVSAVYPTHTTPGRPAFAESAIRSICRLEFNPPRLNGEPVVGLHVQHAEFKISPSAR